MHSRQSLELRQHQQLALTPQLQQSIRFLQLSTHDLEQEMAQALAENPLLEREEEYDTDNADAVAPQEERWPVLGLSNRPAARGSDDEAVRPETAVAETLHDHLLRQLRLTRAQPRDVALVSVLIDELDENGYLATPLEELLQYLPPEFEVQPDELQAALRLLQSFDPPGIAATSLSTCLVQQLDLLKANADAQPHPEVWACAREIAHSHLALLATGNLARLREAISCTHDTLRAAHTLLLHLEPRPARNWSTATADYVTPEVLVRRQGNRWQAAINPAVMPRLRVDPSYEHLLTGARASPELYAQLQQAHGLIKSVNQRFVTILRVAQVIVDRQQAFFEQGPKAMRPLILRDIASQLELHESTVSRATKQKYAQTPWGVVELKRFFGVALATDDGESTSATAVQIMIRKLVEDESPVKPLSDSRIAALLAGHGVVIARRTVAKYREAAGIEPAIRRKARAALE